MNNGFLQLLLSFSRPDTDRRPEVFARHFFDPLLPLSFLILRICLDSFCLPRTLPASFSRRPKCSSADVRQPVPTYRFSVTHACTRPTRCLRGLFGLQFDSVSLYSRRAASCTASLTGTMQPYLRRGFSNLTAIMGQCNEALLWFFFLFCFFSTQCSLLTHLGGCLAFVSGLSGSPGGCVELTMRRS